MKHEFISTIGLIAVCCKCKLKFSWIDILYKKEYRIYGTMNYYCINNLTGHIKYKLILTCDEEIIKGIIE